MKKTMKCLLLATVITTTIGIHQTNAKATDDNELLFTSESAGVVTEKEEIPLLSEIQHLTTSEKIKDITKYYQSYKDRYKRLSKVVFISKDKSIVNNIYDEIIHYKKDNKKIRKELNAIISEVQNDRKKHEKRMSDLFTAMKESDEAAATLDTHVRKKLILFAMKRNMSERRLDALLKEMNEDNNEKLSLHLKEMIRLSKGEDRDSLVKLISLYQEDRSFLFFEHELIETNNLPEDNFMSIPKISSLFSFKFEFNEVTNQYRIYNKHDKMVILDDEKLIFNDIEFGTPDIFQKRNELLYVDYFKLIKLFGYHIEFIGEEKIPYIYQNRLASSPFSMLSVDELIETTFAYNKNKD